MILIGLTIILIDGVNASNNNEYLIDSVNIGDIIDENNHDLISWGPIVKPTGSSWGGGDDGNLRTVWYYEQEKAIGIWHLDENNGLITYDSSNNNYNGKIDGATWDSGKKVNSLYFNGINNSIDFGDITKIDGSKELSISLWVKVDNLSKDLDILSKDIHDWNSQLLLWRDETGTVTGNKDTFSIVVSDGYNEARIEGESNACSDNNWHHICIIFKANDQQGLRLFIDGIEDNNSPVSTLNINRLNSNSNSLLVGKSIDKGKYFNGNIDEICIWGFVLTLQEIEDLFNENIDPYSIVRNLDEPWSSLKMMINNDYVGSRLEIRALDGIADDSFVVYINNNKIYDYADQASTETWITHNIDISNYDITGLITIKILSTSDEWQHFETYGQLGISWLRLYACENGIITTINFRNSNDEPISGGFVEYHDQEWIEFGITDNQGKVNKTLDEGKYSFRIKYYDAYNKIRQDIRKNPIVNFSTKNVSVKFVDSMGLPLPGGNVSLNSGGWKDLGVTGDNGLVFGEFLARKYTFRLCYDGSCISKRQDINDDPLVVFTTLNVTIKFLDNTSYPIENGEVLFYSGGWKLIGYTNDEGKIDKELLPRKYLFKINYNNQKYKKRQNINENSTVIIKPNFKINRKPISIPGGPYKSLINEDIYFNGSKSYDPDGIITNYTWYFDDGNISYGKKTIHNYSKTGSYIIKLKVKDDKGETKSNFTFANITIDIKTTDKDDNNGFNNQIEQNTNKNSNSGSNEPIIFNYVEKNDQTKNENNEEESKKSNDNNKPVAVITGPIKAKKDEILTFDASESYDIDYDELEFRWDYNNDGIWDTEYTKNPQNSYVWKKDYNGQVILEVSDGKGGFDQTSYSIKVEGSIEDIEQLYSSQTNEQDIKLQIPYCILTIISLLIIIFTVIVFRKKFYKK